MSAQIFLDIDQILDLLQAELPSGVYPDDRANDPDPNKRSVSSSELRAHAQMLANLYLNLNEIYDDKYISTVTPEGLAPWEKELFAEVQNGALTYAQRQANLLAKIRANGGISLPAIAQVISAILTPEGLTFDIFSSCEGTNDLTGGWILGVSALGLDTFLGTLDPLIGATRDPLLTPLDCELDYTAAGITLQQLRDIQAQAYTYYVLIYGVADSQTLALLDLRLTELEPARSTHVIINNAQPPVDANVISLGSFQATTPVDVILGGTFTAPQGSFNTWFMGGF